ncbi:MAG TPA: CBS domain-containing protein [Chloroflexia bacterium]|jgi:CBS domain-containing protein
MKVRDIMTKNPETVAPGTSVSDVALMMRDLDVGIIPVVNDGELMGVITDRDIVIRVVASGLNPIDVGVQDFLSPNPVSVSPDDDVDTARDLMAERQIRRLLVTDGSKLVGILSIGDVAIKDQSDDSDTGQVLEEISQPTDYNRTT